MNKINFSKIARSIRTTITKHSPEILTGIGIAGMVTTTVTAVKATPKALALLEMERDYRERTSENGAIDPLTKTDVIKLTWKCYIPSAITCTLSIACLIGASSVNLKRNAALATAYTLSETALKEYQEKVVETIGEKKEQAVRDSIAKDRIAKNPVNTKEVIITEKGNTLCYDTISGRYFKSDIDKLKKAQNELNRRMLNEMYISLNDFYNEIGLSSTKAGEDLGWKIDRGLMELRFSSQIAADDNPCIVIDYEVAPEYDFKNFL